MTTMEQTEAKVLYDEMATHMEQFHALVHSMVETEDSVDIVRLVFRDTEDSDTLTERLFLAYLLDRVRELEGRIHMIEEPLSGTPR